MQLLVLEEEKVNALRGICGAIHYCCVRYQNLEISPHDWKYFCGYLNIPVDTIYSVSIEATGLLLSTRNFLFRYVHNDFHHKRLLYSDRDEK